MTLLTSEAVARARDYLGGDRDHYTLLNGAINSSTDEIPLSYAALGIGRGSLIELRSSTAYELCYVWATDISDTMLTVQRGWGGTTAQSWADGALIALKPQVTDHEVFNAIQDEVLSLNSEGLYKKGTFNLTYDTVEDGYDISGVTDMLSPYAVEIVHGSRTHWAFDFKRDDDLLRLLTIPGSGADSTTLHYRARFSAVASKSTDLVSGVGIPDSAVDIVPLGAGIRLIMNREAQRSQITAQTHARGNEDVSPGDNTRVWQLLAVQRGNRLSDERQRLREDWPMRIR
jgi:hypothetical protein